MNLVLPFRPKPGPTRIVVLHTLDDDEGTLRGNMVESDAEAVALLLDMAGATEDEIELHSWSQMALDQLTRALTEERVGHSFEAVPFERYIRRPKPQTNVLRELEPAERERIKVIAEERTFREQTAAAKAARLRAAMDPAPAPAAVSQPVLEDISEAFRQRYFSEEGVERTLRDAEERRQAHLRSLAEEAEAAALPAQLQSSRASSAVRTGAMMAQHQPTLKAKSAPTSAPRAIYTGSHVPQPDLSFLSKFNIAEFGPSARQLQRHALERAVAEANQKANIFDRTQRPFASIVSTMSPELQTVIKKQLEEAARLEELSTVKGRAKAFAKRVGNALGRKSGQQVAVGLIGLSITYGSVQMSNQIAANIARDEAQRAAEIYRKQLAWSEATAKLEAHIQGVVRLAGLPVSAGASSSIQALDRQIQTFGRYIPPQQPNGSTDLMKEARDTLSAIE